MADAYEFAIDPVPVAPISTTHREIKTAIPQPGTRQVLDRLSRIESRSMHGQLPLVWDRAVDYNVFDSAGNRWIDFTSTIFVANIGHSNPRLLEVLKHQADAQLIGAYAYPVEVRASYLEALVAFAGPPFEKAFLLSAGTEATEAAIKLMRLEGKRLKKRRGGIVVFEGNWHGRTLGAQQLSSNEAQKDWLFTRDPDFIYLPFPYPWNLEDPIQQLLLAINSLEAHGIDISKDICGFMLETFQGWGALFYPKDFVKKVATIAKDIGALLCFDEMQAGFGRTGKPFGFMHYEVSPDLICCGKGMGGGLPVSGVIGRGVIMDLPAVGNMSSTHSGNPLMCSAGLAVLQEIQEKNLCLKADQNGNVLREGLESLCQEFPGMLFGTYGEGLVRSLIFKNSRMNESGSSESAARLASTVVELCFRRGVLLVHTGRESIKFGPPLTIPSDAIEEAIEVLRDVLRDMDSQ